MLKIRPAAWPEHLELARELLREYFDATKAEPCFVTFAAELESLPGRYSPPQGRFYLAFEEGQAAACCAFRKVASGACELKRMYVRPVYRSKGIGRQLALKAVGDARAIGYRRMFLDTLPSMHAAIALYRNLGFKSVAPYSPRPVKGAMCFGLEFD